MISEEIIKAIEWNFSQVQQIWQTCQFKKNANFDKLANQNCPLETWDVVKR